MLIWRVLVRTTDVMLGHQRSSMATHSALPTDNESCALLGSDIVGLVEWRPNSDSNKFQMRNVRYVYDNPGGELSFDTAFQVEGRAGTGEELVVPLDTRDASSILEVVNVSARRNWITVLVYSYRYCA